MADQNFCAAAIDATSRSTNTYIKFLSANDTGLTGGHQSGILLSKKTCPMIFGELPDEHVAKRENIRITWQDDVKLHVDHIVPVSRGGKSVMGNLQTLCEDCNCGKGNRYEE